MTHDLAVQFFAELYHGTHHIPGPDALYKGARVRKHDGGWAVVETDNLSTFDSNRLTRLVLLAHDRCVRVSIEPAGRQLRITIWQMETRVGTHWLAHPTIETAVAVHRETYEGRIEQVKP